MCINHHKKARISIAGLVTALLAVSCVSTSDQQNLAAAKTSTATDMPQTAGFELDTKNRDRVNAYELISESTLEDVEIQGDLEFLSIAEGDVFDLEKFRELLEAEERPSGIVLNFEGADIKRVVALVIGQILNENYLIDPAVKGTVTLKTEKPLNRDTVFYMLETVLDLYGARISKRKGHYRIYPQGSTRILGARLRQHRCPHQAGLRLSHRAAGIRLGQRNGQDPGIGDRRGNRDPRG